MTVSWSRRNASTSAFVISPRNTVAGFIWFLLRSPSGDMGGELADPLDAAGHDVAGLQVAVGSGWRGQAVRRPGRDQVTGAEDHVAAEERDDLRDREAHVRRPAVLDRLPVDGSAELEIGRVELEHRDHPRTRGTEPGHRLAEEPLIAIQPCVARRDVVDDRVAEN